MGQNPNPAADPLARFEWEVAVGGYKLITTTWGVALTPQAAQSEPPSQFRPFTREHAGLFRRFAELTVNEVPDFANHYGMLGPPLRREGDSGPFEILQLPGLYRPMKKQHLDESHSWAAQMQLMRQFLECTRVVRGPEDVVWTDLKPQVNRALLETCAPVLEWNPDPADEFHFRLDWMPHSLLGALWLQAVKSVTRASRFQQCASCGRIMEISREKTTGARADARLCSDKCRAKAYRERKHRAIQLSQQGWTPARIAKDLGSTTATVRGWLKAKK